jgi:hydroxymethylpyrimidine kinase/phosphomethylpyrimidine kinase
MKRRRRPVVCSIGSVDPTTAAGVTADLGVFAAMRARGVSVITGVTAQNAARVVAVHALPAQLVAQQLRVIWDQVPPDAVCIGLIPSAPAIAAVAKFLRGVRPRPPIVVDPVIAASSGPRLLAPAGVRALPGLFRIARVITPNAAEAEILTSRTVASVQDAAQAAPALTRWGCAALVTGGHLPGATSVDVLALPMRSRSPDRGRALQRFASPRLGGVVRGSGGILAAAIATELAHGATLEHAIARARDVVRDAWRAARPLGTGKAQFVAT